MEKKKREKHIKIKAAIKEDIDILKMKKNDIVKKKKLVDKKISFGDANQGEEFITKTVISGGC